MLALPQTKCPHCCLACIVEAVRTPDDMQLVLSLIPAAIVEKARLSSCSQCSPVVSLLLAETITCCNKQ